MFDFIVSISAQNKYAEIPGRYESLNYLNKIEYSETEVAGNNFTVKFKHHSRIEKSYILSDQIYLFKLGNVFANKNHPDKSLINQRSLEPIEIISMYIKHGGNFVKYIKGVYILLLFDENMDKYFIFQSISGLFDVYYHQNENNLILSSSLDQLLGCKGIPKSLDNIALLQHLIFDYPLADRTLFREINILPPQTYLSFDLQKINRIKYFDYSSLLNNQPVLNWKDTLHDIPAIFNDTIDTIISPSAKICSAITSGFDSRTNLSRLIKINKEALNYSWGMKGSLEIQVPLEIAEKLKINYRPIYLDENFESQYDYYAKQAIYWTGGKATIRRANHNYCYQILSGYSREVLTGLIGSELIRPANAVGHIFTKDFIDILYSDNKEIELEKVLNKPIHRMFIKDTFFNEYKDEFIQETLNYFKHFENYGEKYIQLYMFTLTEGIRKYFGHEIHGNRMHVNINTPYIDDDFVEFLLKTPIPALNKFAFERNPSSLKNGQKVYLPIIESNCKELLNIKTGRFYKPKDLLSPIYPLSVIPGMIRKKIHQTKANDTFNNKKWNKLLFEGENGIMQMNNDIFNNMDILIDKKPADLHDSQQFNWNMHIAKQFSIRLWLNNIIS